MEKRNEKRRKRGRRAELIVPGQRTREGRAGGGKVGGGGEKWRRRSRRRRRRKSFSSLFSSIDMQFFLSLAKGTHGTVVKEILESPGQ